MHLDMAGDLGDLGLAFWRTGLEELNHTRQTVGDVFTRDSTSVERTHRELRAGLPDRLGGDDTDRFTHLDQVAGRRRHAVALLAYPVARVTHESAAHHELFHTSIGDLVRHLGRYLGTGRNDDR